MPAKEKYWKDPERCREWTRNYYWAHRAERRAYAKAYYERRYKGNDKEQQQHGLGFPYRITIDTYEKLLSEQGGACAVCRYVPGEGSKRLHVDHCHDSGTIRGLLCNNCNSAIGNAKESAARLRELAEYLERTPPDVPRLPEKRAKRKLPRPETHA